MCTFLCCSPPTIQIPKADKELAESICSVVASMLDCDIVVCEFQIQSPYYVHFCVNTLEKIMNPFVPPAKD